MRIVSVNVGRRSTLTIDETEVASAIGKQPSVGPVRIGPLCLAGDERVEARKFGEPHHAVSVLATEHYAHFMHTLGREFRYGAFGENLTIEGALETLVRVGDVVRCGGATLQVAQPRIPCRKWRHQLGIGSIRTLVEQRRVGFYLRVLTEGDVRAGDGFEVVERATTGPTIDDFFRLSQSDYWDAEGLASLLAAPDLVPMWSHILGEKLRRAREADGWLGFRPMRLRARGPHPELPGFLRLVLGCASGRALPAFEPGQWVACAPPRDTSDLRSRRSCYLLERPTASEYAIAIASSPYEDDPIARWLAHELELAGEVRVAAPRGRATLREAPAEATRRFVFHAGEGSAAAFAISRTSPARAPVHLVATTATNPMADIGPIASNDFGLGFAGRPVLDALADAWTAAGGVPRNLVLERTS